MMVEFLIKRPIATIMSFIAVVMLGFMATNKIPISLLPNINIPEITIYISNENASLYAFENSVVTPFRKQLAQVPGVKDIKSETKNNQSLIRLIFDYGLDVDYAFIEVNDKIDGAMAYMPKEMSRPRIIKASATDIPVFAINVSFKNNSITETDLLQLSEFVNNVVKRRLEQLPEVAIADITGVVSPEIYIIPYEEKFRSLGITIDDIQNAFIENNISAGSILVRDGYYQYNILFDNELNSKEDIENIVIKKGERIFLLNEVAQIDIRTQKRRGLFLNNGEPALSIAVIKHSSAQMNKMKDQVESVIQEFQKDYQNINFEISQDQTKLLNYSINNLKQSLALGGLLAVIIMFLFIRNPRAPLLIAFSIPVSLIVSMLIFHLMGISINIISLSGLILGVGMMIDNSIIVIDNISQHLSSGYGLIKGIVRGTNEVIMPLFSSALTTCAIFLPLIFLSGISGALFYDQAVAVTVGLFVSLVVSITLVPVLYKLFNVNNQKKTKASFVLFNIEEYYTRWFNVVFKYRKLTFLLFFLFILIGDVLFYNLEKKQMPKLDQQEFVAKIDWNDNVGIKTNTERIKKLLKSCDGIKQSNAYIGEQNFLLNKSIDLDMNECLVYINAGKAENLADIKKCFYEKLYFDYPQANITFSPPENIFQKIFSTTNDARLIAEISISLGEFLADSKQANSFCEAVKKEVPDFNIPNFPRQELIVLNIDHQKLLLYNVTQDALEQAIQNAFNQNKLGQIISHNSFVPVVTGRKEQSVNNLLKSTFVVNANGKLIPAQALLTKTKTDTKKSIVSNKGGAYIPVVIVGSHGNNIEKKIEKIEGLSKDFPELDIRFSGSWFETKSLVKEMELVLLISLLLLYFILAAQFESLLQPIIVLTEVPIAIGGSLLMLFIFNSSINVLSLIGIIVMTGIIINDSILKIDTINKLRKSGYSLLEAIHVSGTRRIKPIIMTSLTTILALVPFLFGRDIGSELQYPLVLTVIGGLGIGTLVSLFFVPLLFYFIYRNSK